MFDYTDGYIIYLDYQAKTQDNEYQYLELLRTPGLLRHFVDLVFE